MSYHPQLDLDRWLSEFPLRHFEKKSGPRRFDTSPQDDPIDLWKAHGSAISSPAHLSKVELVRQQVRAKYSLSEPVPVDLFLWQTSPAPLPYLTRLGGVPFRDRRAPWPVDNDGKPYTFVAQFCFLDSLDVLPIKPPGDVLLVFFRDALSYGGNKDDIVLEWVEIDKVDPAKEGECPLPTFTVPKLAGVIHQFVEYGDRTDVEAFEREGHDSGWLFACTQSTKIGTATYFIQGDPRIAHNLEAVDFDLLPSMDDEALSRYLAGRSEVELDATLICTLNSIQLHETWPFVDVRDHSNLPVGRQYNGAYGWGPHEMMFADVGCMYFFLDENGATHWRSDSY